MVELDTLITYLQQDRYNQGTSRKNQQHMDVQFEHHVNIAEDRLGKDAAYLLNSEKIRAEIGWDDDVSLDVGISDCIQWVEKYFDRLVEQPQAYVHKPRSGPASTIDNLKILQKKCADVLLSTQL